MATLPQVSPEGIRAPLLNAGDDPNAFGAGLARAGAQLGDVVGQVEADKRREQVGANVTEAYTTYLNGAFEVLRSPETDENGRANGVLNRQLKDAAGITDEAVKRLDKLSGQVTNGLKSPVEKRIFGEMVARNRASERNVVANHEAEQTDKYRDNTAASMIDALVVAGQQSPMDGQLHADNVDHIRSAVALRYGTKLAPDDLALAQKAAVSHYYASVIASIPDDQIQQAEALVKAHRDDILPADRKKIEDSIAVQNIRDKAQAKADSYYADAKGDEGAVLAKAATITDERVRVETEQKIRQKANDAEAADKRAQGADLDAAWGLYVQGKAIPRDLYSRVLAKNPLALKSMQDDRERKAREAANGPQATDFKAYGDWLLTPESEKLDPKNDPRVMLAGKVSPSQMERAVETVRDIRNAVDGVKRNGEAVVKQKGYDPETLKTAIGLARTANKIGADVANPDDRKAAVAKFDQDVYDAADAWHFEHPDKVLDKAGRDAIILKVLAANVKPPGFSFGDFLKGLIVPPSPSLEGVRPVQPMPDAERASIAARIVASGREASDENIRKVYAVDHAADGARP